jgi:hypothetical protein
MNPPAPAAIPPLLAWCFAKTEWGVWPEPVVRAWWAQACASHDPAVVRCVAQCRQLDNLKVLKDARARRRRWEHWRLRVLTPQVLLGVLNACVETGAVDRQTANRIEAGYLERIDKHGHWMV